MFLLFPFTLRPMTLHITFDNMQMYSAWGVLFFRTSKGFDWTLEIIILTHFLPRSNITGWSFHPSAHLPHHQHCKSQTFLAIFFCLLLPTIFLSLSRNWMTICWTNQLTKTPNTMVIMLFSVLFELSKSIHIVSKKFRQIRLLLTPYLICIQFVFYILSPSSLVLITISPLSFQSRRAPDKSLPPVSFCPLPLSSAAGNACPHSFRYRRPGWYRGGRPGRVNLS